MKFGTTSMSPVVVKEVGAKLPDQTDNGGKFLYTDGENLSWENALVNNVVPQLASVDVLQVSEKERRQRRALGYDDWKGNYSDIVITLNLDKEAIIQNMYDLYVTVSRFKTNKNLNYDEGEGDNYVSYRNIPKFSVMNDLRQKTDKRLYCWRFVADSSYPETNPMRYVYMYTKELYADGQALKEADPDVGLWSNSESTSGIGTCFNAICWTHGYTAAGVYADMRDMDTGIERYEDGDISSYAGTSSTNKQYVERCSCKQYTKDGENYFFWAKDSEWENGGSGKCYGSYLDPIPNGIPKHMDMLSSAFDEVKQLEENGFTFVKNRTDLNYKQVNDFELLLENLETETFGGKYVDASERPPYWVCYWFDYPVMPIMLKDCMVRSHPTNGHWVGWKTLEDVVREGRQDKLSNDLPIELKLPYDSYYLWMRICALQKRCAYGSYSDWLGETGNEISDPMWPYQKHDLYNAVANYNILGKRAFSRYRQGYRVNSSMGKVSEYIHFNVCTHNDVAAGRKSKSTPIQKKLNIDFHAASGLRD